MYCSLVVLWVGSISVQGKKGNCRGNVRASASFQTIHAANNNLIELSSMWRIRIEVVNGRNGVDGEPGTIWSHVGNLVSNVNQEPMSYGFSESCSQQ